MSSSMKAAIHLGPNYLANVEVYKNTNFEEIQSLFNITQKLILDLSEEILNVNTIESAIPSWTRSVLFHDQVIHWIKSKVRVYSDSFQYLEKLSDLSEANRRWEGQVADFQLTASHEELLGIDGEPIEFEWHIFPRHTYDWRCFKRSRTICKNGILNWRIFEIELFSCQCSMTSNGQERKR